VPVFPSVEWFQTAADLLNRSDSFKRLGACDAEIGIDVDGRYFEVDFDAFEVKGVREIDAQRAEALDFVLLQPVDRWQAMLQNIKENGRAEHEFTLNSLDLQGETEFARGKDYHRRDAFYRFNQTFQEYFDITSKMDTVFERQDSLVS
jgi:hypothetical protein